ncbi:MAG TPA: SRPBCC domain-containing protein [Chitinophagaceae bacterium]|nr:SRPBCC domain-containing protein [Chitinophagaceae bacterium]
MEKVYNAPIEKVWRAITDKEEMKKWFFDIAEFKAEPGFEFEFIGQGKHGDQFLHVCKIKEVIKNKKLSYSWGYDGYEGDSLVTFELFEEGNKTRVKLTHAGLESFPVTPNNDFAKENFMQGWTQIIGTGLKEYVEKTGI